jgi:hypothetical protein
MKKISVVLLALSSLLIANSCSRTSDIIGPAACPSDAFVVTTPLVVKDNGSSSTTSLDLSASYANISITFSESISYVLTITGSNSGAIFKLQSAGNSINYNWYGNSTNGKYFVQGDVLSYTLTNICKSEPLGQGSITLTTIIGYSGLGVKVVNYENDPGVTTANYGDVFDCPPYDPDPTTVYGASKLMTSSDGGYVASPQGGNYFHYEAVGTTGDNGDSWYFGGTDFGGVTFTSLGSDPENAYLSFFAKGKANTQVQMLVYENAHGISLKRKFLANVSPDAWKLFTVKLSDIGIINPSNITKLSLNIGATSYQDQTAVADLDLVIFTTGKGF